MLAKPYYQLLNTMSKTLFVSVVQFTDFLLTTDAKLAHPISGMEISKNNKSFLDKLYDAPLNEPLALSFAEELYLYACTHLVASFTTDPQFMTLFYKVMHVPADNHVTETERAAASKNFCATLSMMMEVIETKIGEDTLFMLQKELLNTELPLE